MQAHVQRRCRHGHIKRHPVVECGQRFQIGADLVADIAARGDAVAADEHQVHLTALHQVPARVVSHQRVRHTGLRQFPSGQAGALVAWPCFVHPHMHVDAGCMRLVDRRRGGAPIHGGQPAGVAVGEHVDGPWFAASHGAQQRQPVPANGGVDAHVFFGNGVGRVPGQLLARSRRGRPQQRQHAVQRPHQVDGGGPGLTQRQRSRFNGFVAGVHVALQRQAIRGRGADQRRAAHPHVADGGDDVGHRLQPFGVQPVRQQALVDHHHRAAFAFSAQRAQGLAVDDHCGFFKRASAHGRPHPAAWPPAPGRALRVP